MAVLIAPTLNPHVMLGNNAMNLSLTNLLETKNKNTTHNTKKTIFIDSPYHFEKFSGKNEQIVCRMK